MDSLDTPTTWSIDSQSTVTRADATGNVQQGYDIAFTTGDGNHGVVFVPNNRYTLAYVQAAVHEQAVKVDQVGRLTHATEV